MNIVVAYLSIIKAIYSKPIVNIQINGEELKSNSTKIRDKTRLPICSLTDVVLEVLGRAIKQEMKGIQIGKNKVKMLQFVYSMRVYIGNPQISTTELLQLINILSKMGG